MNEELLEALAKGAAEEMSTIDEGLQDVLDILVENDCITEHSARRAFFSVMSDKLLKKVANLFDEDDDDDDADDESEDSDDECTHFGDLEDLKEDDPELYKFIKGFADGLRDFDCDFHGTVSTTHAKRRSRRG